MELEERRQLLQQAIQIAIKAGQLTLEGYRRRGISVEKKGRVDLVTEYDVKTEALIREQIEALRPDDKIVGEEGSAGARAPRPEDDTPTWYIDPIDGTTNYAHGHPMYSVSIALYEGETPVLGVVNGPALGVIWAGGPELGATRNGGNTRVSATEAMVDALVATGFPYSLDRGKNLEVIARFLPEIQGIRRGGSAALDLCLVADGTCDLYWERKLNAWDVAAGAAILLGAGGKLSDHSGGAFDLFTTEILATNGPLHEAALALLRPPRTGRPRPRP